MAQWCLLKGSTDDLELIRMARLVSYNPKPCSSEIFVDQDKKVFLKAPPIKALLKDNLVKLIGWTSADREYRGSCILRRLGLNTSKILARAIPLNPFNAYRSFLYCDFLADAMPLDEFLRLHPDAPQRRGLLDAVAAQMAIMHFHGISFRDFYFGNILYSGTEGLFWIDTEVQRYRIRLKKPRKKFLEKITFMHDRFLRAGGKTSEWERFFEIVMGRLKIEPQTNHKS